MKIGRNELCPCGSGKKYKQCCLNKIKDEKKYDIDDAKFMGMHSFIEPFTYHNNYIHTKKVKFSKLNKKLLNIYGNRNNMDIKNIIGDYLEIMNHIFDYADEHNIHTIKELDNENLISDFLINVIGDFEDKILNLNKDDYDLNITNKYIDRLINTIKLDDNEYENNLRCKTNSLFKLGKYKLGEEIMLNLINEKQNSIYPYVELVDDYEMVGNLEKSRYYYDLGMKQTKLDEIDVLEERKDYFI